MIARRIVAAIAAIIVATLVVRNAAVQRLAIVKPATAARIWARHPTAEISLAMTEIAQAAHDRRDVPPPVFEMMSDAASREPLAPEPFLVRGVQAQLAGDRATAQEAFEAAQWRDPRSLPAAYFLAERYFQKGDVDRGLREIAAVARLAPNGESTVGPYLAIYARNPANWPKLRTLLRANPRLADTTLVALASNIATVPAVLSLADFRQPTDQAQWLAPLLNTLTTAGQYAKARTIWGRSAAVRPGELIHDASFNDNASPPPFNWSLTSSGVGLAERQPGGRLRVLFYGQDDGILATQLLLLEPGTYRLSMQLLGDAAKAKSLNWSIWCDKGPAPISSVTVDSATRGWRFEVPSGCAAQWLKLSGSSSDIAEQVDISIAALKLERVKTGA
jgi:tetratricopeptide (TPR) repeat protein